MTFCPYKTGEKFGPCLFPGNDINKNISLPQFDLEVELGDDYATDYYDLAYPGVIMKMHFKRKIWFHLMQTYIPSTIFAIVAWLSVFIPPEQVPGKGHINLYSSFLKGFTFLEIRL